MTSTYVTHEEAHPATFQPSRQIREQLLSTSETDDASTQYTYFTVDSTNMTASNLPGAGRLLGNLYSRLGRSLEYMIFSSNAKRLGADPQEVAARIRSMAVWQPPMGAEDSLPFRQHVLELNELRSSDATMLRRCCRAIIYYMCFGSHETVTSALQEMTDLSIRYFPVREAFIAVQAVDTLRLLPLYVKRVGSYDSRQLPTVESMAEKAQLCLRDNAIYSACRESLRSSSHDTELDTARLRLLLENFLGHRRLYFIAANLQVFFRIEQNEPDAESFVRFVEHLAFWKDYGFRRHSVGIQDLHREQRDIIKCYCQVFLGSVKSRFPGMKLAALGAINDLGKRYQSVREALIMLDALDDLLHIMDGAGEEADTTSHELEEIQNFASEALFILQDNEVYKLVKESTLQKPWAPELEGAILRLEFESYLSHPKLKSIAKEYIALLQLSPSISETFVNFIPYPWKFFHPHMNEYGGDNDVKKTMNVVRICRVLVYFVASDDCALDTRINACEYIENMIFDHPSSITYFTDADLLGLLVNVTRIFPPQSLNSDHERKQTSRLVEYSKRILLLFQEHEVFPRTVSYFKELNHTMLDMILEYLRTPELFSLGVRVLLKIWLKVLYLSDDMFCRLVCFLLDELEEIVKYAEGQLLVLSVIEKILYEHRQVTPHLASDYYEACSRLLDTFSSPEYASLYPVVHGTIQEYRAFRDLALYDLYVSDKNTEGTSS